MLTSIKNEGEFQINVGESNPYVSLFWDMIRSAKGAKASDIHIQPEAHGIDLKFRVHGELQVWKSIGQQHKLTYLQEAKRLTGCDLAISGEPQDSRLSVPGARLDLRVNLVPCLEGEKFVLRLLDQSREFSLHRIGLDESVTKALEKALEYPCGVNLLTGPTGSGKTTTLYSALGHLDRTSLNVVTIEDPVEYTFPGITQIPVTRKVSFGGALRAVLRQDPDVILVGEIRDAETAALCFQAAATGHLVLSTLHANSAAEIDQRLKSLGISSDLLESCLRFRSAQRLVQRLCQECSLPLDLVDLASRRRGLPVSVEVEEAKIFRKRNPEGCPYCRSSMTPGITGEIPIFEFIARPSLDEGNEENSSLRSPSLGEAAMALAAKGEIDVYEAIKMA